MIRVEVECEKCWQDFSGTADDWRDHSDDTEGIDIEDIRALALARTSISYQEMMYELITGRTG